jgi:excisionase family DNA binding protein
MEVESVSKTHESLPAWLTVPEAAAILRVHPQTVYEKIRRREIPVKRIGRAIRISREELFSSQAGA